MCIQYFRATVAYSRFRMVVSPVRRRWCQFLKTTARQLMDRRLCFKSTKVLKTRANVFGALPRGVLCDIRRQLSICYYCEECY